MTDAKTLEHFRAEIDTIDDELVALFKQRARIIEKVGVYKRETVHHGLFLRPGREALMVRDMAARNMGRFPPQALAAMWRLLISGSLQMEEPFTIHIAAEDASSPYYWIAREYFGAFTPIQCMGNAAHTLSSLTGGVKAVGVLPFPEDCDSAWWAPLIDTPTLSVFGILPFLPCDSDPGVSALLVAEVKAEPTGDDVTLIATKSQIPITHHPEHLLWRCDAEDQGHHTSLFAINGFLDSGQLPQIHGADSTHYLGAYAKPITT